MSNVLRKHEKNFDTPWYNAKLASGWTQHSGYSTAGYKRSGSRVYLRGLVDGSSGTIFTLPNGFRPDSSKLFACATAGTGGLDIKVDSSGAVSVQEGGSSYFSLEGINFEVEEFLDSV